MQLGGTSGDVAEEAHSIIEEMRARRRAIEEQVRPFCVVVPFSNCPSCAPLPSSAPFQHHAPSAAPPRRRPLVATLR